jgi:N-acyl-D-glutamate deacylase
LVQEAIDRGLRVTTEAYPYGAGSSAIGAEVFRGDDWLQRWGVPDASRMETNGRALSQKEITELQESAPGTIVVMHFLKPEDSERDRDLLDKSVLFPGGAIASDAMPWTDSKGALISEPDVWPLPEGAFAHPRTSGCYSRFLAEFVRKRNAISLSDGLAKCSLIPANIMAESVPQMRTKGRLQVGMDADLMIFDLEKVQDNATFQEPAKLSSGHRHIVVNGVAVIEEGERMPDRLAGRAIRRKV